MNNIYSSYTSSPGGLLDSQKAATLPSMGMPSAYGGLPLSSEAFQRDYGRQNCYISTPCMPNFGTIMDGQKSNTCNGQTSSLFNADVRCTDFWLINNDLQGMKYCFIRRAN
ncbi:hypothetical protein Tcan_16178 [Toxocara canis]|uniref:Uncharacterized protein n=1 Tax=Toxocara canis TaxID=6265 RepID=A0A0B2VSK3_TOXCA|nr:hypothetical protein Tcan_16178 [Toxocara canis]